MKFQKTRNIFIYLITSIVEPEAAESTINTISLIVVFPITVSNYFSKLSKKKRKMSQTIANNIKRQVLFIEKVPLLTCTLYWLSDVLYLSHK